MAISDRLNKLTTDITNAYTSINNKGGTIPANKNTNNLPIAIDSIEVIEQATAEGESLSLTNTKAMPYKDYKIKGKSEQEGEPSPSIPSEIHSVADDVNLFDKDTGIVNALTYTSNGGTTSLASTFIQETYINVNPNTSYTLSTTNDYSTQTPGEYRLVICEYNASKTFIQRNLGAADIHNKYSIQTTSNTYYVRICASKVTINELKLQKGSIATPYSPYNQGTVTIKQRGKNKFKISNFQKKGWNIAIDNPLKGFNSGQYTISCVNAYKEGIGMAIAFSNQPFDGIVGNYFTGYNFGDGNKYYNTQTITQEQIDEEYMRIMPSDNGVTQEILENMQIQIEEGSTATPYEPYQGNNYTFQTEPLRSLPNGVRDSLEADGIHRKVGRVVLDGSEYWKITTNLHDGFVRYYISNYNIGSTSALSDYFLVKDTTSTSTENILECRTNGSILINTNVATTLEDFKTWLSTHNTEVLYELEEEIIEPLTQNQATTMLDIIKTGSYEGTTNIYTDEDVKPTIGVDYYKKK